MPLLWFSLRSIRDSYDHELAHYQRYHRHPINWWIHAITIPIEFMACYMVLAHFNLHLFSALVVADYTVLIGSATSTIVAIANILLAVLAKYVNSNNYIHNNVIIAFAIIQTISFGFQVCIGHWVIEKNQPAMRTKFSLNSVFLSLLMSWDLHKCE